MAKVLPTTSDNSMPYYLLSILIFILLSVPSTSAMVVDASENWNGPYEVSGGRSLLVEELSATWCESCAEIDPYLMDAADTHGSRIAIITYHPSDDFDAFQPPASQHRIERLEITHPNIGSTPSFVVQGGELRVGPESWPDVQKDILTKEVNNQNPSDIEFNVQKNENKIQARITNFHNNGNGDNISQLTFILAQHSIVVPSGFENPGQKMRDRVVIGVAECNLQNNSITYLEGFGNAEVLGDSCSSGFLVTVDEIETEFSILLIHERISQNLSSQDSTSSTYGVVEFAYRDVVFSNSWNNLLIFLFGFTIIGFLWISYEKPRKLS